MVLFIRWNIDPEIFRIGKFALRYYSLMFVLAFVCSYLIMQKIFKQEELPPGLLGKFAIYIFMGTIIGARLGDCLFYDWDYYQHHLLEIILPFRWDNGHFAITGYQGLASHGGAIGILLSVFLYTRKYKMDFLWLLDRLVIVVALSGFFIRTGNLFNSEIIGKPASVPWAFIFERVDGIPRHPTQIYEALSYLVIFFILWYIYKTRYKFLKKGYIFGLFLILLFSIRFLVEFLKEDQEPFEKNLPLNMGQLLSIPFILLGIFLLIRRQKKTTDTANA